MRRPLNAEAEKNVSYNLVCRQAAQEQLTDLKCGKITEETADWVRKNVVELFEC